MAGPNQSDFDAAELYKQTKARQKNKDRHQLSEHVRYVHDTMEEADIETVLGLLDSWASEIKHLEDSLESCKRAVNNLHGNL